MTGGNLLQWLQSSRLALSTPALLIAGVLTSCVTVEATAEECQLVDKVNGEPFKVYQIMGYRNIPDLGTHCVERLKIWYGHEFWPNGVPRKDDFD
ncbi:MAG: hypothetical protein AAGA73_15825, partial [Pseudomonadota bacterium]